MSNSAFLGTCHPYPDIPGGGWGACFVRGGRLRKPACNDPCPLCKEASEVFTSGRAEYRVADNHNPILTPQLMIWPAQHRVDIEAVDVECALAVVEASLAPGGPSDLRYPFLARFAGGAAIYANPNRNSGQSVRHLHLGLVPADGVPLPCVRPADCPLAGGPGAARLTQAVGLPYRALLLEGPAEELADIGEKLAALFDNLGLGWNLLVFPSALGASTPVSMVVVPRSAVRSAVADQDIGGLELLSGVLLPGPSVAVEEFTSGHCDRALQETTLSDGQWSELAQELRGVFGLELTGFNVVAERAEVLQPV